MTPRRVSSLLLVIGLLACGESAPLSDLPERPGLNVIVVSFDALRADALGVYGNPRDLSPKIDEFAADSVVFENFYSTASITTESFAAAFTGRLPLESLRSWRVQGETVAEQFRAAGYATAAFMQNAQLSPTRGFDRGFQQYRVFTEIGAGSEQKVLQEASSWLQPRVHEPIFLWVHFIDPHSPWHVRESAKHLYDRALELPANGVAAGKFVEHDPVALEVDRSLYDGEVFTSDRVFGTLVSILAALDLLDRSLVVLTADHGEEFMQHGWLVHGQLNEENVRIPLILRHPDVTEGRRVATVASQLDLFPTLLSLAGLQAKDAGHGRDLREVGGDADPLLAVTRSVRGWQQASIRRGGRKLILECGERVAEGSVPRRQLYDLTSDPAETRNLADSEPEAAGVLEEQLWSLLGIRGCDELRQEGGAKAERQGLTAEEIQQLEELGYLE